MAIDEIQHPATS